MTATTVTKSVKEVFERFAKPLHDPQRPDGVQPIIPATVSVPRDGVRSVVPISTIKGFAQLCTDSAENTLITLAWSSDGIGATAIVKSAQVEKDRVQVEVVRFRTHPGGQHLGPEGEQKLIWLDDLSLEPWLQFIP